MKIYIPSHLRNLVVVDQMCKMIEGYQKEYKESIDPYYYYYSSPSLDYDPVKKFLGICLSDTKDDNIQESERLNKIKNIVNYLTKLFYSVKGCRDKIIEFLGNYSGIEILNVEYSTEDYSMSIYIESIPNPKRNSEEFFKDLFEKFLRSLLMIGNFSLKINKLDLEITGDVNYLVNSDVQIYNEVTYVCKDSEIII